ncbi:hypothetical protein JXA63_05140 [Candidatus Woesebacteria bacterium]|nr:hypothetical protein [Candidatus Woesebacteria bacterium]
MDNFPKKVMNILYPPFCEIDAGILMISFASFIYEFRNDVVGALENELFIDFEPRFIILLAFFIFWIFVVVKNLLTKDKIMQWRKNGIAVTFYFIVGFLSLFSATDQLPVTKINSTGVVGYFNLINRIIILFILIRSSFSLMMLKLFKRSDELGMQMTDEQADKTDIILAVLLTPAFYLLLRTKYIPLNSILLSFFYSSFVINARKRLSSPTFYKMS